MRAYILPSSPVCTRLDPVSNMILRLRVRVWRNKSHHTKAMEGVAFNSVCIPLVSLPSAKRSLGTQFT